MKEIKIEKIDWINMVYGERLFVFDPQTGEGWFQKDYGGALLPSMYFYRQISFPVQAEAPDGPAIVKWLLTEGKIYLQAICKGFSYHVDNQGNKWGQMDYFADAAWTKIKEYLCSPPILPGEYPGAHSAWDWFDLMGHAGVVDEYGITAETTDEKLEEIGEKIAEENAAEYRVLNGIHTYLQEVRETLIEEA